MPTILTDEQLQALISKTIDDTLRLYGIAKDSRASTQTFPLAKRRHKSPERDYTQELLQLLQNSSQPLDGHQLRSGLKTSENKYYAALRTLLSSGQITKQTKNKKSYFFIASINNINL